MGSPLHQFFSFNYTVGDPTINRTESNTIELAEPDVDLHTTFDYQLFAKAKGKIWIRLSNLEDRFDRINSFERYEVKHIDVEALALYLYQAANPFDKPPRKPLITVQELTLSGLGADELTKIQHEEAWNTGDQAAEAPEPEDLAGHRGAAFGAQRIRMYEVTYQIAPITAQEDLSA